MSLVGGIISAKTNSHDLLARSSTCYRCRLEEANNTGSLAKIKQNMLNISVKHIHTNSQKTAIHVLVCWFFQSSWSSFMSPFTLEHSMIAGYISKTTTMHSIKQVFSNQIVDFSCLQSPENHHTSSCSSVTAVRVRLANQSAVLVTRGGSESTLRSGTVTLWHITWAAALAVALGTAEISGQSLHTDGFLIGFAASLWVAVVSGVGCHGHLQHATSVKGKMPKVAENQCKYLGNSV